MGKCEDLQRWTEASTCKQANKRIGCMEMIIREEQQGRYRRNQVGRGLCVKDNESEMEIE